MTSDDEIVRRLREANRPLTVPAEVRRRQVAAITSVLDSPAHLVPGANAAAPGTIPLKQRWLLAASAAAIALLPTIVALSANGALPGDRMYGLKRVYEQAASVFDDDIRATNRVDELEVLIDRGDRPDLIVEARLRATEEVRWLPAGHQLKQHLERLALGWGEGSDDLEYDVDWEEGATVQSSLPDGELLTVAYAGDAAAEQRYVLTVTGRWYVISSTDGWRLSNRSATDPQDGALVFDLAVDPEGLTITSQAPPPD